MARASYKVSQRIAILVDAENIEINVSDHYEPAGGKKSGYLAYPDWKTIIPDIAKGRKIVRNIYYKKSGLKVSDKFRRMWEEDFGGEIRQPIKSVDPYIIVDSITLCEKADVIVILAGDKDYLPLIWYLRSRGCKVEMASFEEAAAEIIKTSVDLFYMLEEQHTISIQRTKV